MHIGVLCPTGTGHVNPMATLCRALMSRGHEVTVLVPPDGERKVRSFGLGYHAISEREFPHGELDATRATLGTLSGREARNFTVDLYLRTTIGMLRDAPQVIEEVGIEGLIVDQTSTAGRSIAEHAGIPFVTVCCALLLDFEASVPPVFTGWPYRDTSLARWRNRFGNSMFARLVRPIHRTIGLQRRAWGLPELSLKELNASPLVQLCQAPREFDYPRRELPPHMHYVGPLHDLSVRPEVPFDLSRLDGRPLIYASMGSLQNKLGHVFEEIARATSGLDAQVVLSFGRADAPVPDELPGSPIIVKYAPQLDLIERASLVITHAGMNTAMESLACGVPMVAIPVTNDQPAVAARIAWTGTGEVVPFDRLTADRLRSRVRRVLEDGSYRRNAGRLQHAIRVAGGVARAADLVEDALTDRRPVLAAS